MRAFASLLALAVLLPSALGALTACASGPVFNGITGVKVRHIGTEGLVDTQLDATQQRSLIDCLYRTQQVEESDALRELLQTTYLLEISDSSGDRLFELYTAQNLKGNKGRYYVNGCVLPLIRSVK